MIILLTALACLQYTVHEHQEPSKDEPHQSLAQLLALINLCSPLIDNQLVCSSHVPALSIVVSTEAFRRTVYVTPPLLEPLHVAISKLEHDDPLDCI